jgi:hypothetical protein
MTHILPVLPDIVIFLGDVEYGRKEYEGNLITHYMKDLFDVQNIRSKIGLFRVEQGISCKPFDVGVSCLGISPHERIAWQYSIN